MRLVAGLEHHIRWVRNFEHIHHQVGMEAETEVDLVAIPEEVVEFGVVEVLAALVLVAVEGQELDLPDQP